MARKLIRVVAPGRPISPMIAEQVGAIFDRHPIAATHQLEFDPQCFLLEGHFAGSDCVRADALIAAFEDDRVDVIWGANGGYGTCRLLDSAVPIAVSSRAKVVAGYSDFDFLLCALYGRSRHHLLHAPMPLDASRLDGAAAIVRTLDAFREQSFPLASGPENPTFVCNLSIFTKIIGTPYEPNLAAHLLILEDVGEHWYAIDRMLFQVSEYALRVGCAGVGVGLFTAVPPNDPPWLIPIADMFDRWFVRRGVPVKQGLSFGHTSENKTQWLGPCPS